VPGITREGSSRQAAAAAAAASVNREFYHGRVLSLENCATNLIATRESRYSRGQLDYASKQGKCLPARRSFSARDFDPLDRTRLRGLEDAGFRMLPERETRATIAIP